MVKEEIEIKMSDRTLIYQSCSHREVLDSQHTLIFYVGRNPHSFFKLKKVKEKVEVEIPLENENLLEVPGV